jgi:hypothetical protein
MNPLALVGFAGLAVIVIGILWFVFSSKKEQAHIAGKASSTLTDLADAANPTTQPIRADIAADIAKVEASKAAAAPVPPASV